MILFEIILLIVAYTSLTITLFLEIICYRRNLENRETIAFTASLLVLIISLTVSPLVDSTASDTIPTFTLLAMILVSVTTPLNTLTERQHEIDEKWKRFLIGFSILLFVVTTAAHSFEVIHHTISYVVAIFLGISVVLSMSLVWTTKPNRQIAQREKTERLFAIAFIVLVPLSLFANYWVENEHSALKLGFTLPIVFILLSGNKLLDDLQRLGIMNPSLEPKDQHLVNYALSEREKEIAVLLTQGKTYKQISEALFISMPTVKTHVSNIYKKCGTNSRAKLTALLIS